MSLAPVPRTPARRGAEVTVPLSAQMLPGYHTNSDKPADEYLIPLKLSWITGPLEAQQVTYPAPQMEHYKFSEKPVSVFSGQFTIQTRFRTAANAQAGMAIEKGKLRYQACNEKECLQPKTVEVQFAVDVR